MPDPMNRLIRLLKADAQLEREGLEQSRATSADATLPRAARGDLSVPSSLAPRPLTRAERLAEFEERNPPAAFARLAAAYAGGSEESGEAPPELTPLGPAGSAEAWPFAFVWRISPPAGAAGPWPFDIEVASPDGVATTTIVSAGPTVACRADVGRLASLSRHPAGTRLSWRVRVQTPAGAWTEPLPFTPTPPAPPRLADGLQELGLRAESLGRFGDAASLYDLLDDPLLRHLCREAMASRQVHALDQQIEAAYKSGDKAARAGVDGLERLQRHWKERADEDARAVGVHRDSAGDRDMRPRS